MAHSSLIGFKTLAQGFNLLAVALVFITISVMFAGASSAKAGTVELQARSFAHDLAPDIRFFEDTEKTLSIEQVLRLDAQRDFSAVATPLVDFGFSRSRYWLRVPVRNTTNEKATWKLAVEVPYIEFLRVYLIPSGGSHETLLTYEEASRFSERGLNYRYFAPDVVLGAGEQAEIILAYSSKQATQLPISIESPEHFQERIRSEDLVNWSLLVLLIGMTLASTIYLVALGFRMAVFYGIYVLLSALYLFHTDGYAFQYLWPGWPGWNGVAVAPIGLAMVASGSLFARAYVEAPTYFPILNRLLLGSVGVVGGLILLSPWFIQDEIYKQGSLLFIIVCAVFYFTAGVMAVRRGQAGAWFFVAASLAIISTIVFGVFGYLNPGEFNQDIAGYYGRYALFFEGIAFSLAIFLHIQAMRSAHDAALLREFEATREKLAISEALHKAQKSHEHAMNIAEARRAQLATTAHDIKQPLMSLRMAMMRLKGNDAKVAEQIGQSFDYLDDLVRSSLEQTAPLDNKDDQTTSSEHGTVHANLAHDGVNVSTDDLEEFPVMVVLSNVLAMFRDEAQEKGLVLTLVPSSAMVRSQPVALMRIVSNLVSNAIKYAEKGRVLIGCRHKEEALRIEIHDTGPGIPAQEIKRLMKPYERGSTPGGTGLGLAVVCELCHHYGMTFDMSSRPGHGTISILTVSLN